MTYDPNQPRDPAGTSTGGQWTDTGATSPWDAGLTPYDRWVKSLTPEEREVVDAWLGIGFGFIREGDRTGQDMVELSTSSKPGSTRGDIVSVEAFRRAIARAPAVEDIPIYRGFSNLKPEVADRLSAVGAEMTLDAFTSFSADEDIGLRFSANHTHQADRRFVLWEVAKARSGHLLEPTKSEKEIIVQKGARYRILRREPLKVRVGVKSLAKPYTSRGWRVWLEEIAA